MTLRSRYLGPLACSAAMIMPASAALAGGGLKDAPVAPVNWTGFYAGANIGYAWAESGQSRTLVGDLFKDSGYQGRTDEWSISDRGLNGGVQAGYNWQTGGLVFGIEADLNFVKAKPEQSNVLTLRSAAGVNPPITVAARDKNKASVDYFATLRGRLGFATNALLIYATGGLAYAKVDHSFSQSFHIANTGTPCVSALLSMCMQGSKSSNKAGWVLGGGAEVALSQNWSLKAEYLYTKFGKISSESLGEVDAGPIRVKLPSSKVSRSADLELQTVRVGVNYRF